MTEELKPHQIAQLVNKLRDIATKYHAHGCLRELISREVNAALTQRPAAQTERAQTVIGKIRPGRHVTRDGKEVYIACRCAFTASRAKNDYPWWVEDGKGGWSVDDTGRHMKNGNTSFDIVARAGDDPATSLPAQPAAQATPDHAAEIARLKAVIDQLERREILAVAQQATPEPVAWLDEMLADTREVFDAGGSETPQVVRDVIEYVRSWVTVYSEKNHPAPAAQPAPSEPAPGVPEGFALVPVEPTAAMLHCIVYDQYPQDADEGRKLQRKQLGEPNSEDHVPFKTEFELAVGQYKRMLAAAQAKGGDK